jgi:hypothetical protein
VEKMILDFFPLGQHPHPEAKQLIHSIRNEARLGEGAKLGEADSRKLPLP